MTVKNPNFNRFLPGVGYLGPTPSTAKTVKKVGLKNWGEGWDAYQYNNHGSGIYLHVAKGTPRVRDVFKGIAYLRKLAAHRRRIKKEEAGIAARDKALTEHRLDGPRSDWRPQLPERGYGNGTTRKWDTLLVCNCATCGRMLLGESDECVRADLLSVGRRKVANKLPPPVALRNKHGQPFCEKCAEAGKK